ncbi:MAG: amino acid--tRNA ligase-related protein [Bdellovibrionota bacterium]
MLKNLKTLFELRKTNSLSARTCCGRVFFYEGKMGLCDASSTLWPVFLAENYTPPSLQEGDVISFTSQFIYKSHEGVDKKYDDLHYLLVVQEIIEHTPCLEEWENSVYASPIPNLSQFKLKDTNHTCFYKSPTKYRFRIIQSRSRALERTKKFFLNRNFVEIESPTLVPSGGYEDYINPFVTEYTDHKGKKTQLQLPTSPEFALKKILAELTPQIFQISRAYRNGGELSIWHEPEFFMLEWYRMGASLKDILNDTQNLVMTLAEYLGSNLEIPKNWPRFRVDELFKNILNIDLNLLQNKDDFYKIAKPLSFSVVETDSWVDIFCKLFMEKIEPYLKEQKACFVTHYPVQMAALAAVEKDTNFALRGEAFLHGIEICNAYQELVDAKILQDRVLKSKELRPNLMQDELFENAMNFGLPPCAGNALGIDRVIALLLGEKNISSLYPIPFLAQFPKGVVAEE